MIVFKDLIDKTYISTHIPFSIKIIFTSHGNSFSLSYISNNAKYTFYRLNSNFNMAKFFQGWLASQILSSPRPVRQN